jgi:hypothetical protein
MVDDNMNYRWLRPIRIIAQGYECTHRKHGRYIAIRAPEDIGQEEFYREIRAAEEARQKSI